MTIDEQLQQAGVRLSSTLHRHVDPPPLRSRSHGASLALAALVAIALVAGALWWSDRGDDGSTVATDTAEPTPESEPPNVTGSANRVVVALGIADGSVEPWELEAHLDPRDDVCLTVVTIATCGPPPTATQQLGPWFLQESPSRSCAFGVVDDRVGSVEVRFSDGSTVDAPLNENDVFEAGFFGYCRSGESQLTSLAVKDLSGNRLIDTAPPSAWTIPDCTTDNTQPCIAELDSIDPDGSVVPRDITADDLQLSGGQCSTTGFTTDDVIVLCAFPVEGGTLIVGNDPTEPTYVRTEIDGVVSLFPLYNQDGQGTLLPGQATSSQLLRSNSVIATMTAQ